MIRSIFLLSFSLLLMAASCNTAKLEVISATSQETVGGAAGSGGSTKFEVILRIPENGTLTVNKVWMGNKEKGRLYSEVTTKPVIPAGATAKGKTSPEGMTDMKLNYRYTWRPKDRSNPDSPVVKTPAETAAPSMLPDGYEKGGLIWYSLNGKDGIATIGQFNKLEGQYMP